MEEGAQAPAQRLQQLNLEAGRDAWRQLAAVRMAQDHGEQAAVAHLHASIITQYSRQPVVATGHNAAARMRQVLGMRA